MTYFLKQTKRHYNIIAEHFSEKRRYIWEDLRPYLKLVKQNDKVLDLGCGNARLLKELKKKNIDYLGIDFSKNLLKIAKKNYPKEEFKLADITKKKTFKGLKDYDVCFCVAVFHNFFSKKTQKQVLKNIKKILKDNGILIITVWNLWHKGYWHYHLKQLPWKILRGFKLRWVKIPYKISDGIKITKKVDRYYYAFSKKEFENLIKQAGFKIIEKKMERNLCIVAKKVVKF